MSSEHVTGATPASIELDRLRREAETLKAEIARLLADAGQIRPPLADPFRTAFEAAPNPYLLLAANSPFFTIVGVNDPYLRVTGTKREALIGRSLFEAFPDNPARPEADGAATFRASVERVIATGQADRMALQRYDLRDAEGIWRERYWSPLNVPIFGSDSRVTAIVHHVEEATSRVLIERKRQAEAGEVAGQVAMLLKSGAVAGTFKWDAVRGRIYGDERAAQRLGRDIDWLRAGQPIDAILEIVHPDDRATLREAAARVIDGADDVRLECRLPGMEDVWRWVEMIASVQHDRQHRPLSAHGVLIDIDERKEATARQGLVVALGDTLRTLNQSRAIRARAVAMLGQHLGADRVAYGEVELDDLHVTVEEEWLAPGARSLRGRHRLDAFGAPMIDALRANQTIRFDDTAGSPLVDPAVAVAYATIGVAAGVAVPLVKQGRLAATLSVTRGRPYRWREGDVTLIQEVAERTWDAVERARAEEALQAMNLSLGQQVEERTRELQQIWRTTRDMLCVADFDNRFLSLNPAWTTTLGWSADEMKAVGFIDLVHPEDRAATLQAMSGLARGEEVLGFENRYRHRDGSYRCLSWNSVPRENLVYAVVRDVTIEKEQAAELRLVEAQLRQAHKMEAVGQLTGGIAHDFNNLLTGIVGSLDLMQTRLRQGRTDRLEHYAEAAMTSANRAAALTHRLLAFSRRQPLDPKPVDIQDLVGSMADLLRRTIGESIALKIVAAAEHWTALCDPNQLESGILNLAINARDAMPNGGALTIETRNTTIDAAYASRHPDLRQGDHVVLSVSDTGTGMPQAVIDKAFDPFFTTKPIGQGTGLGLSMIYGFARQSDGHVHIASEVGEGTTVTLFLPRFLGTAETTQEVAGVASDDRAAAGETVLVVEDEPIVRELILDVLRDLGYLALEASDGPAGLRILRTETRIDLLVTDVGLPGMNGRQLAEQGRETRPELKVLFITGYAEDASLGPGYGAGMQTITKPFPVRLLAARLRAMIAG